MEFGYKVYMLAMALFTLPIFITPFLAAAGNPAAGALYSFYSFTCHQQVSRSICYFPGSGIGDCSDVAAHYRAYEVEKGGLAGYPFPVCARDVGIYFAALLSGALLLFLKKTDVNIVPNPLWFIIALIPIGLDGGTQLIGLRESTNLLRLLTGGIAGFAFSFYVVPLLNRAFPNAPRKK
jgi:uncharacterized membrane protein